MTAIVRPLRALPDHTSETWRSIAGVVPAAAYLIGGTGLAVHLAHRSSQDLDFCIERRIALDDLRSDLESRGSVAVDTLIDEQLQTLNLFFVAHGSNQPATKIQFLDATRCRAVDVFTEVAGLRIAGIGDLLATKLAAIMGRAALRDYFDLMVIETQSHRHVEEGLALFVERYQPKDADQSVRTIIDALVSFNDVEADPHLVSLATGHRVGLTEIRDYWERRVVDIARHLERDGIADLPARPSPSY